MMRLIFFFFLFFILLNKSWPLDIPVNITGVIIIPPCEINNGNPINVDFGNIRATELDNIEHIKTVKFPVYCPYHQGSAYVKITGNNINGRDNVLSTNINGLGIELYQGETTAIPLVLGGGSSGNGFEVTDVFSDKNIDRFSFTITAKVYKDKDVIINSGEFYATALIDIVYL